MSVKLNFDGVTLHAVLAELQELRGGIIQRIYELGSREGLTIHLWLPGRGSHVLLVAFRPPRFQMTTRDYPYPARPSPFVMLLRKHLRGGVLLDLLQPGLERIAYLHIRRGVTDYQLIFELFGHGNAVLAKLDLDGEAELEGSSVEVLGTLHPGDGARPLRPHTAYIPPSADKHGLLAITEVELDALLASADASMKDNINSTDTDKGKPTWRVLFERLEGLGPRLARELVQRAGIAAEKPAALLAPSERAQLWRALQGLQGIIRERRWEPQLYFEGDRPVNVAPFPLQIYADQGLRNEPRATLSAALDELFAHAEAEDETASYRQRLLSAIDERLQRAERARAHVLQDLRKTEDYERYRHQADLLLAHIAELQRGQREALLQDPLDKKILKIELDPQLSPAENAQRLYARYKKLKRGQEKLRARLAELESELEHLRGVRQRLAEAPGLAELKGLAAELEGQGIIKVYTERERDKPARTGPREYLISGYRVLVGRSGRENDLLVRTADREDLWLHAREMPGAHVIIKTKGHRGPVPQEVLLRAAQLAAYYSQGRGGSKVPVSYTAIKYLRKPKGARPGTVLVQHEEGTLLVSPRLPEEVTAR